MREPGSGRGLVAGVEGGVVGQVENWGVWPMVGRVEDWGVWPSQLAVGESWQHGGMPYFCLGQWRAWWSFLQMTQICCFVHGLWQSSCQDQASQMRWQ